VQATGTAGGYDFLGNPFLLHFICPVCGRSLFKGRPESYIEGGCPKSKNYLQISYTPEGVQSVVSSTREKTEYDHAEEIS